MGEVDGRCHGCNGAEHETQSRYGKYRVWLCPSCLKYRQGIDETLDKICNAASSQLKTMKPEDGASYWALEEILQAIKKYENR